MGMKINLSKGCALCIFFLFLGTTFIPLQSIGNDQITALTSVSAKRDAPTYGWTTTLGGVDYDQGNGVATDTHGNIYATGQFSGTIDFDPTDGVDIHEFQGGSWDVYLTKRNVDGSYGWTSTIGDVGSESGRAITIDKNNNVIIVGEFCGPDFAPGYTVDFNPTKGSDLFTTNGMTDTFITKLASDGSYLWTRTFGGPQFDNPTDVAVDAAGNIYLTGYFMATVDFDPTEGTDYHSEPTGQFGDVYITRLNADGSYGWTKTFGGQTDYDTGENIAVDSHGDILVTGQYTQTITLDSLGQFTAHEYEDFYVLKMSNTGTYLWFYSPGGPNNDYGGAVTTDSQNNVIVTGGFHGTLDFDPTSGTDIHQTHGTYDIDIYLTKLSADGSYGWTQTFGGTYYPEVGDGISVDALGNIFVVGRFGNSVDFDPSDGQDIHQSAGSEDVFITKYSPEGLYNWTYTVGGTSFDNVYDCSLDTQGTLAVTGLFNGTVDFDPTGGVDTHMSNGGFDVFILTLLHAGASTPDQEPPQIHLTTPLQGYLYLAGYQLPRRNPSAQPLILGTITLTATAMDNLSGIRVVEFSIDGAVRFTANVSPYEWTWTDRYYTKFSHTITVVAYDLAGNSRSVELDVWKIF